MVRAHLAALMLLGVMSMTNLWSDAVPKVLVEDVAQPVGVAVQPETGHIFVAEAGEGRVTRIVDGKLQPVIVGLPNWQTNSSPVRLVGLEFIDRQTLVLGVSASVGLDAAVCIAQIPEPGSEPLQFDSLIRLGPLAKTDDSAGPSEFLGVTASKSAIYVVESNKANRSVLQSNIKNLKNLSQAESFGPVTRLIATKDEVKLQAPAGITLSARGEIVVGQLGTIDQARDSLVSFFRSTDGRLLLSLETGLFDIVAIQYGASKPPSNQANLYVLDRALTSPEFAGLYRLDAEFRRGKQGVRAVKVASLDLPAAMALGNDGSMYVALLGSTDDSERSGKVLQFEPGL